MSEFKFQRLSGKLIRRLGFHFPVGSWSHAHWCPACESMHDFAVEQPFGNGAKWAYDGNAAAPTFAPSMNIRIGPYPSDDEAKPGRTDVCHYFLQAGKIKYLDDCTHTMKGMTIDLPDIPADALRWSTET